MGATNPAYGPHNAEETRDSFGDLDFDVKDWIIQRIYSEDLTELRRCPTAATRRTPST